ncbi:putative PhzF superfamily epimerase YddE/YHI9 [Nocardia sp. GAS34]|uniref:hypothetical protein n=1 Tax=unclassified Nocardia TaxID=2637762 RepID=UPI003D2621A2
MAIRPNGQEKHGPETISARHVGMDMNQGDDLGRPAILGVELRQDDPRVRVSGAAVALPD